MRSRILLGGEGWQYHHVVSRVVDRRIIFGDVEKRFFREWLGRYAAFSGLKVMTYCLMGNHFHLLIGFSRGEVERFAREATDEMLLERAAAIYEPETVGSLRHELAGYRRAADLDAVDAFRGALLGRMGDLSSFVQALKLRFTRWFNGRNDRVGTLWESRFRSVLVEGQRAALETVAAYIDLNPVRAGIVTTPENYRFSGYAEAVGGGAAAAMAREGIAGVVDLGHEGTSGGGQEGWEEVQRRYRTLLFGRGVRTGIIDGAAAGVVLKSGGALSVAKALRCRVRYLTEGGAIGTKAFIDEVFRQGKAEGKFGSRRTTGAREMRGADWRGLVALRALQRDPILPVQPVGGGGSMMARTNALES